MPTPMFCWTPTTPSLTSSRPSAIASTGCWSAAARPRRRPSSSSSPSTRACGAGWNGARFPPSACACCALRSSLPSSAFPCPRRRERRSISSFLPSPAFCCPRRWPWSRPLPAAASPSQWSPTAFPTCSIAASSYPACCPIWTRWWSPGSGAAKAGSRLGGPGPGSPGLPRSNQGPAGGRLAQLRHGRGGQRGRLRRLVQSPRKPRPQGQPFYEITRLSTLLHLVNHP